MASATTQEFCVCEELTYCVVCGLIVQRHSYGWEVEEEDSRLFLVLSSFVNLPEVVSAADGKGRCNLGTVTPRGDQNFPVADSCNFKDFAGI